MDRGAANFVSAITAAYWAHSPVVAVTPETGSMGIGTVVSRNWTRCPGSRRCTKFQVRVNRPERMAELARRCFYIAKAECGPTQLNIPRDYFYGEIDCEIFKTAGVPRGAGPEADLGEIRSTGGASILRRPSC